MSDSNSERFDGKKHVPDEASNSTGSGTVCPATRNHRKRERRRSDERF